MQLHHPIDRSEIPFRLRRTNKVIHIAGKQAAEDRNGTWDFMREYPTGTVLTQSHDLAYNIRRRYREARVIEGIDDNASMYSYGDILVLPRRYGGNCLVLNEALASGMPVIMPDIVPNNHLLPKEWLVPATVTSTFSPRTQVDVYSCLPGELRNKIDWMREQDIEQLSQQASDIADTISWETLKPEFLRYLNALHEGTL